MLRRFRTVTAAIALLVGAPANARSLGAANDLMLDALSTYDEAMRLEGDDRGQLLGEVRDMLGDLKENFPDSVPGMILNMGYPLAGIDPSSLESSGDDKAQSATSDGIEKKVSVGKIEYTRTSFEDQGIEFEIAFALNAFPDGSIKISVTDFTGTVNPDASFNWFEGDHPFPLQLMVTARGDCENCEPVFQGQSETFARYADGKIEVVSLPEDVMVPADKGNAVKTFLLGVVGEGAGPDRQSIIFLMPNGQVTLGRVVGDGGSNDEKTNTELTRDDQRQLGVQILRCLNMNNISGEAEKATTTIQFSLGKGGELLSNSIRLVSSTAAGEHARVAFENFRRAIIQCGEQGFALPSERYEAWKTMLITYDGTDDRLLVEGGREPGGTRQSTAIPIPGTKKPRQTESGILTEARPARNLEEVVVADRAFADQSLDYATRVVLKPKSNGSLLVTITDLAARYAPNGKFNVFERSKEFPLKLHVVVRKDCNDCANPFVFSERSPAFGRFRRGNVELTSLPASVTVPAEAVEKADIVSWALFGEDAVDEGSIIFLSPNSEYSLAKLKAGGSSDEPKALPDAKPEVDPRDLSFLGTRVGVFAYGEGKCEEEARLLKTRDDDIVWYERFKLFDGVSMYDYEYSCDITDVVPVKDLLNVTLRCDAEGDIQEVRQTWRISSPENFEVQYEDGRKFQYRFCRPEKS